MQITNKEKKATKFGIFIFVTFILGSGLFIGFQVFNKQSSAVGGGFQNVVTTTTTVNSTTSASSTNTVWNIKGTYIVIEATSFNPSITVSSISDTASDTYILAIKSNHFEDSEIWYANYTGTNFAGNTATVTFSGSTSSVVRVYRLSGVIIGALQTTSNFGTATSASVGSFTPNNNFACLNFISAFTGSATVTTWGSPNFFVGQTSSQLSTLMFDDDSQYQNNWASYGATTITTSMTPTSSPQWDDTVSCFPTGGVGSTVSTTSTSTTTFTATSTLSTATVTTGASGGSVITTNAVTNATSSNPILFNLYGASSTPRSIGIINTQNYLYGLFAFQIPNVHIISITDNYSDIWVMAIKSNHNYNTEIWYAHYIGINFASNVRLTINLNTTTTMISSVGVITGLNTTTVGTIITSIGFGTTAPLTVAQFNPPSHDVCLSYNSLNVQTTNTVSHGLVQYFDESASQLGTGSINTFSGTWYLGTNWNFSNGLTTLSESITGIGLNPIWDKVVACFQTGQTQFVTTTSTSTTTTSTQSTTTTTIFTNTTTTSTSTFNSTTTLTSTNTSFVTSTGTVIPEPLHSTDLLLILLAILIFLILIVVGLIKKNPFPTFLGATVLLIMNVGLYTNNLIVYGQNLITTPIWVNQMISLLVVFAFMLVIYQLIKRRY